MGDRFELTVLHEGHVAHAVPIPDTPLNIGRAPTNDLVLGDNSVSWHHAQVWVEGASVWIRDLASRNGTYVNDDRVNRATRVEIGDTLRIGFERVLHVRGDAAAGGARTQPLFVEGVATGIRVALRSDRFCIGAAEDADLRIPDAAERAATILVYDDELFLGVDTEERLLAVGEVFEVAGRSLRVVVEATAQAPTVDQRVHAYPYRATADSEGASGHQVLLEDPPTGRELLLTGNRGVLLFLLVDQLHKDCAEGKALSEQGWCSDADISSAIWGRGAPDPNRLHVLVHRLRKALQSAGFDPWFIEKRHWGLRARIGEVSVR